jgi:hypothetical protein
MAYNLMRRRVDMKRRGTAIVIGLLVVLSNPVFANQDSCEESYEFALGLAEGSMKSSASGWGLIGFGLPILGTLLGSMVGWDGWCDDRWVKCGLTGLVVGVISSTLAPFVFQLQLEATPEHISEDGLECYLDGYGKGARPKIMRRAIAGSLLGGSTALLTIGAVHLAHCGFGFSIGFPMRLPIGWGGGPGW